MTLLLLIDGIIIIYFVEKLMGLVLLDLPPFQQQLNKMILISNLLTIKVSSFSKTFSFMVIKTLCIILRNNRSPTGFSQVLPNGHILYSYSILLTED